MLPAQRPRTAEAPRHTTHQKAAFPVQRAPRTSQLPRTATPRTPAVPWMLPAQRPRTAEAPRHTTHQKAAFPVQRATRTPRPPQTVTPRTPAVPWVLPAQRPRTTEAPRRTTHRKAAFPVRRATRMSRPPGTPRVIPAWWTGCALCPAERPPTGNPVGLVDLVIRHMKVGNIRTGIPGMRGVGSASITLLFPPGTASRVGGGVDPVIDNLNVTKSGYVGVMRFPGCCPDAHAVRAEGIKPDGARVPCAPGGSGEDRCAF
ncbi:hypothetical protein FHS44_000489 [Streptosporangium saharense]|uniref:Uncharacterized protein n=1 Tax=Streptosporangium saharense TaxID=1706840 RepID=A0A7W7QGZ4_9ACTN|nr:hypothetical protein [Streptosporangium saharense]